MNSESLKLLALKECISELNSKDVKELFKDMNELLLIDLKLALNSELDNYKNIRYVVVNKCFKECAFSDLGLKFIQKYFPEIKYLYQINLSRCHPILVLTTLLLGENINNMWSNYTIEKIELKYFEAYKIINNNGYESIYKMSIDKPYKQLEERPPNLFSDIQQYTKDHDVELDLSKIEEFPKTGPYRVFD